MLQLSATLIETVGVETLKGIIHSNKSKFGYNNQTGAIYATIDMWRSLRQIAINNL